MMTGGWDVALTNLEESVESLEAGPARLARVRPPRPLAVRPLVVELTQQWERANQRRLTRPGDDEEEGDAPRPEIPLLSPGEVLSRWRHGGADWVRAGSRLDLRALVLAARDASVGPDLLSDHAFWPSFKARLRERVADQVLNSGYFLPGDLAWIEAAIRARARAAPAEVPRWWVHPGPAADALASEVARAAATSTYGEVLEELGLPDGLPESFLTTVAREFQASRTTELASVRTFLDRGVEMGNRAVILESTRMWARRATQMGGRFPQERLGIAELLRARIGELAAGRDEARWAGLEKERAMLRTWLIGEIFRVVFTHLVPDGPHRHMTEPRRKFWSQYDHSVEKIWLLICDDHRERLSGDEAVDKLHVHGLLDVLRFSGASEQDALWMHLRSRTGEMVTVLEGNANMPIRMQQGALPPPLAPRSSSHPVGRTVGYYAAKAKFPEHEEPKAINHNGDWQSRTTNALSDLSVYPRGDR